MERVILHSDMNAFYCSVEMLYDPALRGKPMAVATQGDNREGKGIILTKSREAKACGVITGEPIWKARQKCKDIILVPPHYDEYLRISRLARSIYNSYTDKVESMGIDECFLDVTNTKVSSARGVNAARLIRDQIHEQLGVTVSVGVADNKIFAKLGSDLADYGEIMFLPAEKYDTIIYPLDVSQLFYVGRATQAKLYKYGIHTIGQLAKTQPEYLEKWFGKIGHLLYTFANGLDTTPVMNTGDESIIKSIGNGITAHRNLENENDVKIIMLMLCESVAERLRRHGFFAGEVCICVRSSQLTSYTHQCQLARPTYISTDLCNTAMTLFRDSYDWHQPVRSVSIRAGRLTTVDTPVQISFFENESKRIKRESLERTIDEIRRRFGHYSINRAITLTDETIGPINAKDDHVIYPIGFFRNGAV